MSIDWIPIGASRKITAKERGNRGIFPSNKVKDGIVEYESGLERDFFFECHHAPDVMKFQHQPVTIYYKDTKGKNRKYSPDVYVELYDGTKGLFEIKYEEEVRNKGELYKERWNEARKWGKKRNIFFKVLTEEKIRTARRFNIWFTLGSSKCTSAAPYIPKLTSLIPEKGERYDQLCHLLSETQGLEINKSAQIICYAIYHGLVFLDSFSTKEISNGSIIRKKKRNTSLSFKPLWDELKINIPAAYESEHEAIIVDELSPNDNALNTLNFKIPLKYEEKIKRKIKLVKLWLSQPINRRTFEWRDEFCNEWGISERTAYNWIKAYKRDGVGGLMPNNQKSGRQTPFNKVTLDLLEKARQYYKNPATSLKQGYAKLKEYCNAIKNPIPTEALYRKYIYKNTTAEEFAKKRGNKYHKSYFTPSLASFQGAFAPMQIVQMDNTSFDVFPVDSEYRKGLSTPYMTAAIDCYSRMLTGFSISYFPSSSRSVLDVLIQTILPKNNYTKAYGSQQGWPIQGFPVLLLVDNGMDYRSKALREFCIKYDMIIEYAPIRTPRYKALIEQWFNILRNALGSEDVSGTRPLLRQRLENPELKPEAEAVLTLQEIEEWVHKWVLDDYNFTNPYDDHAPAPHLRWVDFQDGHTKTFLPLPREPPGEKKEIDMLYISTLERIERRLSYDGVVWEYLKYNNRELSKLYNIIGKMNVDVLLNPRDIRCVWVVNPRSSIPIKVDLGSGWAQAITKIHGNKPIHASAWKMDIRQLKKMLKTRLSPFLYQKEMSRMKRNEIIRNAKKITKKTRREMEKVKETNRKSISHPVFSSSLNSVEKSEDNIKSKDFSNEKKKKKKKNIDWSKVSTLPTDNFPTDY
jgi:transposase InsO family protein